MANAGDADSDRLDDPQLIASYAKWIVPSVFAIYVGSFTLLAWAISFLTDFGADVDTRFHELLAQVLVTVLLAVVIEEATASARPLSEFQEVSREEYLRASKFWEGTMFATVAMFVFGEACVMYAVATDESSTFIVAVPVMIAIALIARLVTGLRARAGLGRSILAEQLMRARERAQVRAAQGSEARGDN